MASELLYHALEALRHEVLSLHAGLKDEFKAVSQGNKEALSAEVTAVKDSVDKIEASVEQVENHLRTLNGRTGKLDTEVARLKLVVFTMGGGAFLIFLNFALDIAKELFTKALDSSAIISLLFQ